mgnify:CR=1 FL=1
MYQVLIPTYRRVGDAWAVDWVCIGKAEDMADAKAKFCGAPVLQKDNP